MTVTTTEATGSTEAEDAAPLPARSPHRRRKDLPGPRVLVSRSQADRYIGSRIDDILRFQGLSRPWLAAQMEYDLSAISLVLRGKRTITPQFVARACWALRLPPSVVFIERERTRARRVVVDDDTPTHERDVAD